jgi:lipoprotein-anchoring transpeptidase ErfK/SrfK
LIEYELTPADLEGPYAGVIPNDLMAQARLKALAYSDSLEAIAERFHASPRLLRTLNPKATFARAGDRIRVPNVTPFTVPEPVASRPAGRAAGGRGTGAGAAAAAQPPAVRIVVSKSESVLTVEDESGAVLFHAPVTSGSEHDPLPIGMWKVTGVQRLPTFHYNPELFWDADPSHSKATIAPGPNNPVGVAWIDLSKEHYGIHGTPEPGTVGHVQSHGCVRVTNWDAVRLLAWVRPGTPVEFRE